MSDSTIPESNRRGERELASPALGLVVLWCPPHPDRVGAWLPVMNGSWILGRGPAQATDAHPRLPLLRQRPGANVTLSPFELAAVSRVQLVVERRGVGELELRNAGRCRLGVNGHDATTAIVQPGDVVEIGQQLSLLCVERPSRIRSAAQVGEFGAPDLDGIVGESEAAWELRARIAFVAPRKGHVLVRGESGTGKELVANAVHRVSGRGGPFVARNAATIPETLIDAELFGNAENYPNPGMRDRKGLIGTAHGGTLFLDEFSELSTALQAHLLRVLDSGEYQRLGDAAARRVDLRLVAATNRPTSDLRYDMLARFDATVEVPALTSRREDIPLLVVRLLDLMALEDPFVRERFFAADGARRVSFDLIRGLVSTPPPGNVRGLRKALWSAIERSTGDVIDGLPDQSSESNIDDASTADDPRLDVDGVDALRLTRALEASGGSIERARRELGLSSRFVMMRLMKKHGVTIHKRPATSQ